MSQHGLGDYSSQGPREARLWGRWGVRLGAAQTGRRRWEEKVQFTPFVLILSPGVSAPPPELIPPNPVS